MTTAVKHLPVLAGSGHPQSAAEKGIDARAHRRSALVAQVFRKCVQLSVATFVIYAAFGTHWRNFKLAHNNARIVSLIEGDTWGTLYAWNNDSLALLGEPYRASFDFLGLPWASTVFGVTGADPILAASFAVNNGLFSVPLMLSALIPVGLAIVFGKLFCSHLCPMRLSFEIGQWVRGGLFRLGIVLPRLRSPVRLGGWLLLGGLGAAFFAGMGVWLVLLPYVSLTAGVFLWIGTGAAGVLLLVAAFWLTVDSLIAPGFFCKNLCPTGFVLENLGRRSFWGLKNNERAECPTNCHACEQICPYALSPRRAVAGRSSAGAACDGCGSCVTVCPKQKLERRFSMPKLLPKPLRKMAVPLLLVLALLALLAPGVAEAHHNKGLPHYGYYENYPQVPTEESVVIQGRWEMGASTFNFQGYDRRSADTPNDVKFFVYLYDLTTDQSYKGPIAFEIRLDDKLISRFERETVDEEAVYSTRETLPETGEYELIALMPGQKPVVLPFSIDLRDGSVNWTVVGAISAPVLLVFLLALMGRAGKGKAKRMKAQATVLGTLIVSFSLLGATVARRSLAQDAQEAHAGHDHAAMLRAQAEANAAKAKAQPEPADKAHAGHDHAAMLRAQAVAAKKQPDGAMDHGAMDHGAMDHGAMGHGTMQHYGTDDGGQVMVMGGIPYWMFLFAVGFVILGSFAMTERFGKATEDKPWRLNLIRQKRVYNIIKSRWFQAIPQLLAVFFLVLIIYAGLAGARHGNIAPVAVWTLWWGGLIFAVVVLGPIFCFMCPWDGLANLVSRLRVAARVPTLSLGIEVPHWLRNMWPAIALFVLLTWAELGLGITSDPRGTAYLALGMVGAAVAFALLFRKKAFCQYLCPVGRIQGMYGNFSPIELRARNKKVCERCTTEDCLNGNENGYACPTGISLKVVQNATDCIGCTECIKSCDKRNVALNLRPFGGDLLQNIPMPRRDEAWMCLMLLSLTLFHGFSMTTVWENYQPGTMSVLKWMSVNWGTPHWVNFTVGMVVASSIPIALYWLCCRAAAWWVRDTGVTMQTIFRNYALSLLPVALFYHLSHNVMHLIMEGGHIVPLLSDPLGTGADYFGTASMNVGSLLSESTIWYIQLALIIVGHIFGVVVAYRISRRLFPARERATQRAQSLVPITAVMVLLSVVALWLMVPDMNMRIGRM